MVVKIFVLGLPGSGKSTATRYMEGLARDKRWHPNRYNDFQLLYKMFQDDTDHRQFSPVSGHDYAFDVRESIVFDTVLQDIEKRVRDAEQHDQTHKYGVPEVIFIEFARNDYTQALQLFSAPVLRNAHFLFIVSDRDTCHKRIRERTDHPETEDDHYLSEESWERCYSQDSQLYDFSVLALNSLYDRDGQRYGIRKEQIHTISNGVGMSMRDFACEIERFFYSVLSSDEQHEPTSAPVNSAPAMVGISSAK